MYCMYVLPQRVLLKEPTEQHCTRALTLTLISHFILCSIVQRVFPVIIIRLGLDSSLAISLQKSLKAPAYLLLCHLAGRTPGKPQLLVLFSHWSENQNSFESFCPDFTSNRWNEMERHPKFDTMPPHFNAHLYHLALPLRVVHLVSSRFKSDLKWGYACLAISWGCLAISSPTETAKFPVPGYFTPKLKWPDTPCSLLWDVRPTRKKAPWSSRWFDFGCSEFNRLFIKILA